MLFNKQTQEKLLNSPNKQVLKSKLTVAQINLKSKCQTLTEVSE